MSESRRICANCRTPLPMEAMFCLACGTPTPTQAEGMAAPGFEAAQVERLKRALEGRYAVEQVLGQGGMAIVYVADDVRHHRKVAIKVLRPELAAALGPDRFLREIQVVAQLHHPHILMLIDSGEADGALFYVMPYIEGESLRSRLARERELPIAEAVRILRDVADALAHAHKHGIVHRDIKPDNILMAGRHALVADFGIAKAVSQATQHGAVTSAGVSLGTPAYMAPEQATADPNVDHRADIYSLGVVAYELLTGERPFYSTSPQNVLAAHVTQKPVPVEQKRPAIPPVLAAIVMRCLEKHAADRWQTADELLTQLESLVTPSLGMTPTSARLVTRPSPRPRWLVPAAGVGIVAIVAAVAMLLRGPSGPPPPATTRQLTFEGNVGGAEISPDGRSILYAVSTVDTDFAMVRDISGGAPVRIAAVRFVGDLRWAPDGSSVFVSSAGWNGRWSFAIYPRLGGPARVVACSAYAAFSHDGARLACWSQGQHARIGFLTLATGDTTSVDQPDTSSFKNGGDWSPTAALLAVNTVNAATGRWSLRVLDIASKTWRVAVSDTLALSSPCWAPDGSALYYLRRGAGELRRQRVGKSGEPRGEPVVIQTGVQGDEISVTAAGDRLVYTRVIARSNVAALAERAAGSGRFEAVRLTEGTALRRSATLSPDGAWVAYSEERGGQTDLFVVPARGGAPRQLTTSGRVGGGPVWSPDGTHLAFGMTVQGVQRVAVVSVNGGVAHVYARTQMGDSDLSWAPAQNILYQLPGNHNFNWLDPRTEVESVLVRNPPRVGWMFRPSVSPDGRRVAVDWNRNPEGGVFVLTAGDTVPHLVAGRGGRGLLQPAGWSADGRGVYVRRFAPDDIALFPIAGGAPRRVLSLPAPKADCGVKETPRGIRMACMLPETESDAWLMEGFDGRRR